jgi:hypothetical protein
MSLLKKSALALSASSLGPAAADDGSASSVDKAAKLLKRKSRRASGKFSPTRSRRGRGECAAAGGRRGANHHITIISYHGSSFYFKARATREVISSPLRWSGDATARGAVGAVVWLQ